MALLDDAFSPVVAFERTVECHADVGHAGKRRESLFDLAVESWNAINGVTGAGRIEVEDVAIVGSNAEILMLEIAE